MVSIAYCSKFKFQINFAQARRCRERRRRGGNEEEKSKKNGRVICVSISWRARVRRDRSSSWRGLRMGASWDEATCRLRPRHPSPTATLSLPPLAFRAPWWGTVEGPSGEPPQPLSERTHRYSILALCFSTLVILENDYAVWIFAKPRGNLDGRLRWSAWLLR